MPSPNQPRALITGCDIQFGSSHQHGDLWELGNCYIFNAVGELGHKDYFYGSPYLLVVRDQDHQNYFERHNVYVVPKVEAQLNAEGIEYISRGTSL